MTDLTASLSPEELQIRLVDLEAHRECCVDFLRDSFLCSFSDDRVWQRTFGDSGERYRQWLENYEGNMFHAWKDGSIVGELMLEPDSGYMQHIYVVPEQRRTGIASLLHAYFIEKLTESGQRNAFLKVSRTNQVAKAFYLRHKWIYVRPDESDQKLDVLSLALY